MADDKDVRDLADAKKLPLPDRIAHTNWKARVAAYEDISAACREIYDDADPKLNEFAPLFPKAVSEPNAAAVDKALDALSAFLAKASEQHASRICEKTCANMVAKCLSARTSTLTRVLEVMLLFVELEQADKVMEALVAGLSNKNPKVVVAALEMIYNTVNLFGHRVVTPKPIIVALPALFESKDGKAREKVKEIVVELSRWMGPDAIRAVLFDKMRDAMRDDISRAMELAEPARVPPRLTRKQQAKAADVQEQAPAASAGADGAAGGLAPMEEDMPEAADPYDYAEPKKVAQELTSANFFAKLEEKKWTERRDAVLFLKGLADTPRIAPGDFGDVMRELKKLITKDSNVVVVAESINCVGLLAKGLRKEFASWARNTASALLEKFKEKNTNVGNAVSTALTYMHKYCWHLTEVVEDLTEAMGHANPKVKEDTYKWLTEAIKQEPKANLKGLVPALMGAAAKGAEEAAPALREAAQGFMVAFTVRFGNTAVLEKFTTKMDDARKKKLQDMVAEAMGGGGGSAAPAPAAAAPAATTPVRASMAPSLSLKSRLPAGGSRPTTAARPSTAAPAASAASAGGGSAAAPKKAAGGGDGDDDASLAGGSLSRDQAVAALTEMFGEALVAALQDDQWKSRLDAMETVAGRSADPSVAAASGSMLVQAMSHVPSAGWGEKNFQVMAKQFEVLRNIAAGNPAFSKRDAFTCINGLIDKVGDLKLKQPSFETLTCLAEAVGPQFVMAQLHKKAAAHKNPKVQSEAINWIARAITEFGLAGCDVRALLDWAKEDLGSANAGVRNAAIQMLGVMYRFLGPALGDMIRADVKPALMTAIDGEFAKNADLGKPEPTRFSRAAAPARGGAGGKAAGGKGGAGVGGGAAAAGSGGGGGFDADDLLPRTDISGQITGELVGLLGSANWKERKAALDSIETILTQAGNRIQPQTGDLLPELKKRLADSNKNLTTQALTVLGRIAKAMGRAIDRNGKPLLAPAVKNITDQKQTVRSAVTEMLDAWVGVTSASAVMPDVMEFYTSSKITADGKAETLRWLGALVAAGKVGECVGDALKAAAIGGADKAAEVRDAASKLLAALIEMVGPAELGLAAQGLDANSRKAALEAISKATGAPVPVAAAATVAAASSRPSTAAVRSSTTSLRASTTTLPRGTLNSTSRPGTAKPAGGLLNKSIAGASMAAAAADAGALITPDNKKEERAKKGRFRPAKLQIMPDEAQTLEAEFGPLLGPALKAAAFSKDFKKHCEAADMITKSLPATYDDVIAVVDLLFRWSTLRILESNTASLVKVLELLKLLLDLMIERGYRLSEYESKLILPAVVEKSGHNQDKLKAEHRELLRRFALVYPPVKVIAYVKDGLESKNSKTRVVCMDEIAAIVDRSGPVVYRAAAPVAGSRPASAAAGETVMAAVAKLVAERDTAVRAACLGVMEVLYCIEGVAIWDYLGRLTDQQKSLIEERIKAAGNRMARAGQVPGYKAAEYNLAPVQDDPMMVSPGPGNATTPRRPASPMQRSGIGLGVAAGTAAAAGPAASPGYGRPTAGAGILESQQLRAATIAAPVPASGFAAAAAVPLGPGQPGSPMQVTAAQLPAAAADPAAAAAAGYDVRRISSPMMMNRYNSFQLQQGQAPAVGASVGVLTMLDGGSEEETIRNWVIMLDRLQGVDWEEAIQAMKLLCFSYMEVDRQSRHVEALLMDARNVDELVLVLAGRLDQSLWDASASTLCLPGGPVYNARACKYSINALMNMCNLHQLTARIGDAALTKLFSALLAALIDARLRQVADGDGLLKAVNMMIMKLLEQASRSGVFGALVALLRTPNPRIYEMATAATTLEAARAENLLRWNDMVVKCLIKMTKQLATIIPTINVGEVLVHLHRYMQALGADEVRRRSSLEDKPLRMVKTMLHELCKHRGYDIYKDMENMPGVHELPEEMVMMPYIRLNLDTLHIDKRPATAAPGGAGAAALTAAAAAPRPATAPSAEVPSTSGAAPTAAPVARPRGIPSAFSGAANSPAAAQPQVLAPLSTNSMAPPQQPGAAASPKVSAPVVAAPAAVAATAPAPLATSTSAPLNLDPSSAEFTRPVTDEQEARNILAAIFKRIGDKSQSNQALVDLHHFMEANPNIDVLNQMMSQVSPYFKTYLSRGLNKVKLQMSHAAAAAAAAQEQQQPAAAVAAAAPAVARQQQSSDGGMAPPASSGTARTASSTWSTPDGDATARPTVITVAEKLAISEARSPASPGRLRGVGNLDELRSRMINLSTNLSDLPVRASNPAVAQSAAMSQDLLDLQERMKKIQNLGAAS